MAAGRVVVPGSVDVTGILAAILPGYALRTDGPHGPEHWARVLDTGLRLAAVTRADPVVVTYFALFHDARRLNDEVDDGHGRRGAELARSLRGGCVRLRDDDFDLLDLACRDHTAGRVVPDPTIQTCWDADRLDLPRVGIPTDPRRLGSDAARALIDWSDERAVFGMVPDFYRETWRPVIRSLRPDGR